MISTVPAAPGSLCPVQMGLVLLFVTASGVHRKVTVGRIWAVVVLEAENGG